MPGEVLDRLAELGRIERHQEGDLIHAAWRPVRRLWLILGGGLRVTELDRHGHAVTLAVLGEGSYFASASLVKDGMPEKWEAHAIGETDLAVFELALLWRCWSACSRWPRPMGHERLRHQTRQCRAHASHTEQVAGRSAPAVRGWTLSQARRASPDPCPCPRRP
jgi:hypothetical protein